MTCSFSSGGSLSTMISVTLSFSSWGLGLGDFRFQRGIAYDFIDTIGLLERHSGMRMHSLSKRTTRPGIGAAKRLEEQDATAAIAGREDMHEI